MMWASSPKRPEWWVNLVSAASQIPLSTQGLPCNPLLLSNLLSPSYINHLVPLVSMSSSSSLSSLAEICNPISVKLIIRSWNILPKFARQWVSRPQEIRRQMNHRIKFAVHWSSSWVLHFQLLQLLQHTFHISDQSLYQLLSHVFFYRLEILRL